MINLLKLHRLIPAWPDQGAIANLLCPDKFLFVKQTAD